jgi:hypothetical protein
MYLRKYLNSYFYAVKNYQDLLVQLIEGMELRGEKLILWKICVVSLQSFIIISDKSSINRFIYIRM